jgi:hypothetical protein
MEGGSAQVRAPSVELEAIGHGRKLRIDALGAPAVLIFVARETSVSARSVVDAVRARYPMASQVVVATVADLRGTPRLARRVARGRMKESYEHAVARLEESQAPEDYVLILPDWDGAVMKALGIDDLSRTIAVAVIDASGNLTGLYHGFDSATRALALLELARG